VSRGGAGVRVDDDFTVVTVIGVGIEIFDAVGMRSSSFSQIRIVAAIGDGGRSPQCCPQLSAGLTVHLVDQFHDDFDICCCLVASYEGDHRCAPAHVRRRDFGPAPALPEHRKQKPRNGRAPAAMAGASRSARASC
jgi:hypothetical protein